MIKIYIVRKDCYFEKNAVLINFIHQRILKKVSQVPKILSSTTVSNTNKKQ